MVDSELNGKDNSLNIVLEFAEIDLAKMLARHPVPPPSPLTPF